MTTDTQSTPFDQPSAARSSSPDPESGGAYSFDGKRDQWGRYRLPHPKTGKAGGFTRMTTFAKSISDTYTLSQWSQRMVGDGLVQNADLMMAWAALPLDDRKGKNNLAEKAKERAGAKIGANLGTALHSFSEMIDRGESPNIPGPYRPHIAAYQALLAEYDLEVLDIERVVLCLDYDGKGVAGTLDRVVRFRRDITVEVSGGAQHTFRKGTVAILDLKTGKTMEYGGLEIAVQLSGYANADVYWDKERLEWFEPDWLDVMDREVALVLHLPATAPGEMVEAAMMAVDIRAGREIAELCTQVREARKRKGLMTKLAVVREAAVSAVMVDDGGNPEDGVVTEHPAITVGTMRAITAPAEPPLVERAATARTHGELNDIWLRAMATRQDTDELWHAITVRNQQILADTAAG